MRAWIIHKTCDLTKEYEPLQLTDVKKPEIIEGEILVKTNVCGICHTEIDEIEGRTSPLTFPMIPGHQVVGTIEKTRGKRKDLIPGDRVGIAWINSSCGRCDYCIKGQENLCPEFRATGRDVFGGYAEYVKVHEDFVYAIPSVFKDEEAAPLLCAGAVGYRSLVLSQMQNGYAAELTGFGASGHLVLKLIKHLYPDTEVYVFARNQDERKYAIDQGCFWAGNTDETPPRLLNCIIDTTPVWKPVIEALRILRPGGRLVINAIRKESFNSDWLLKLDYTKHLWMEKEIKSVANVTRKDVRDFLQIAASASLKPEVQVYPFLHANRAIMDIKNRKIRGAKVLKLL